MATVPSVIAHVGWHELIARDVEPAKTFYAQLFGWEIVPWRPGAEEYPMVRVDGRDHGGFLALDRPPHWLVYVEVPDADDVAARVRSLGGRVFAGPTEIPDVGRFVVLADPQGAVLAAIQVERQGRRPAGVFAWDELLTTDPAAARAFYGELFGWQTEEVAEEYDLFHAEGESVAGLMRKPDEAPASAWLTYVWTDDLGATLARAEQLGAVVTVPGVSVPGVGRFGVMIDPVGAPVGVLEPAT